MTEQQTPDREKKIAEIRKSLEFNEIWWGSVQEGEPISQDEIEEVRDLITNSRFLLSELERLEREYAEERAAHNAHVAELCELESKISELDNYHRMLHARNERLKKVDEERDKLIECLRWYADAVNYEYRTSYLDQDAPIIDDNGQRARNILREIGVKVDVTGGDGK